jgi:peptidoglycan/LPS O-acetylase OafA/YrhL
VLSFYVRRAFRILPFWWLTTLGLYLAPEWPTRPGPFTPANLAAHLTFTFGLVPAFQNSLVPGGWSLFCEETFYLFLPQIFFRVRSARAAAALCLLGLGVHGVWLALRGDADPEFTFFSPPAQWWAFALGILVFFIVRARTTETTSPRLGAALDLATLVAVPCLLLDSLVPGTIGCAILFLRSADPRSVLHRLTTTRVLQLFGISCYSIYLAHPLILHVLSPLRRPIFAATALEHAPREVRAFAWFLIMAAACLAFGLTAFFLIEKPCVRLGKRVIAALQQRTPVVDAVSTS